MELDSKIDGAAATANADFLAEASLYPTAPIPNLEERLRSIFGPDATYAPFDGAPLGGALLVTKDGVTREELQRYASAIVVLKTRARFIAMTPLDPRGNLLHVELVVYAKNPHGPRDLSPFFTWGHTTLRDLERVLVGPNVVCPCGAHHVVFRSKRALQSDPEITVPFPCQKCGRSTLVVQAWKGGSGEAHLKERLPEERIAWLPEKSSDTSDPHAVTQDDYPEHFNREARRAFKSTGSGGEGSSFRWVAVTVPIVMMIVRLASTGARSSYTPPPVTPLSLAPFGHAGDPPSTCAGDRECFVTTLSAFDLEASIARRPQLAAAAKEAIIKLGEDGSCEAALTPIETIRKAEIDPKTDPTLLLKQVDVLVASIQYCDRGLAPTRPTTVGPALSPTLNPP